MFSEYASANKWTEHDGPPPEALVQENKSPASKDNSFCRIPRWILKTGLWSHLKGAEAQLLVAITYFANQKRGYRAWPRMNTLAKMAGLHPETLRMAKKELKKKGLINYGYAPNLGPGSFIWLATSEPFLFSDDCKKNLSENEHAA